MAIEIVVVKNDGETESKFKRKVRELKTKTKAKVRQAKEWAAENQEKAFLIVTAIGSCGVKVISSTVKHRCKKAELRKEEELKEEYCYDRSLGHYWRLKRKLTNDEWLEIEHRRKNGERLADILNSMKVLY